MRAGDTFISTLDGGHLWVIVYGPDETGDLICATFTTRREKSDTTTVCDIGEHPFFRHETIVLHNQTLIYGLNELAGYIEDGTFVLRERCSSALLQKVYDGILKSPFTPRYIRKALPPR